MRLKDFVPPVIVNGLRKTRDRMRSAHDQRRIFASHALAEEACGGQQGYQQKTLVEVVRRKTEIYRANLLAGGPKKPTIGDLQLLSAICLADVREPIRVIDFGGACGAHYFMARALLGDRRRLSWNVIETPAMVREARLLENEELKFFDSLDEAIRQLGGIDVLFSSCTLHYVPNPYETLRRLVGCGAKQLVLARLSVTTGPRERFVAQESALSKNGPGPLPAGFEDAKCKYPFTLLVRPKVEAIVTEHYRLTMEMPDASGAFPLDNEPIEGIGYVAERIPN